jgi:DNA ligase (NAD+)
LKWINNWIDYVVKDQPQIADWEYDQLMRELLDLESACSELRSSDSATGRGGKPLAMLDSVKHEMENY